MFIEFTIPRFRFAPAERNVRVTSPTTLRSAGARILLALRVYKHLAPNGATSQPLPESFNAQISDDCTNQANQRIRRSENIRQGESKRGRMLRAAEASELSHKEVRVEEEDNKANFSERPQDLFRND